MSIARYVVNPDDPRAPTEEVWAALGAEERRRVLSNLPSEVPRSMPPEGDAHRIPKTRALEALDQYYRRIGRRIYLSSELPVYYPDEPMFAPDLIAVLDVDPHERSSWVVSQEEKGLDFVLEVHVSGDAKKDAELNVERYARLQIPEHFTFEPLRGRLVGTGSRARTLASTNRSCLRKADGLRACSTSTSPSTRTDCGFSMGRLPSSTRAQREHAFPWDMSRAFPWMRRADVVGVRRAESK